MLASLRWALPRSPATSLADTPSSRPKVSAYWPAHSPSS